MLMNLNKQFSDYRSAKKNGKPDAQAKKDAFIDSYMKVYDNASYNDKWSMRLRNAMSPDLLIENADAGYEDIKKMVGEGRMRIEAAERQFIRNYRALSVNKLRDRQRGYYYDFTDRKFRSLINIFEDVMSNNHKKDVLKALGKDSIHYI